MYHICSSEQNRNFSLAALPILGVLRHLLPMLKRQPAPPQLARVKYLDADLQVLSPGDHVKCAVTGRQIPLAALRYWSVERQEAYWDAAAAAQRMGYENDG